MPNIVTVTQLGKAHVFREISKATRRRARDTCKAAIRAGTAPTG